MVPPAFDNAGFYNYSRFTLLAPLRHNVANYVKIHHDKPQLLY